MWRHRYKPLWRIWGDSLLVILTGAGDDPYGLPPVSGNKSEALTILFNELANRTSEPRVCRADKEFIEGFVDQDRFIVTEDRDNSDYVYLARNLIDLPGRKYHSAKADRQYQDHYD